MNRVCVMCGSPFAGHCNAQFCGAECRQKRRLIGNKIWGATYRAKNRKPRPEPEPIPPFPGGIDRDEFGNWLSGFCDGESTFGLRVTRHKTHFHHAVYFRITLRDDDTECLRLIRSYWGVGMIYFADNARSKVANAHPVTIYSIHAVPDLMKTVVPHFERFPLRSKKRNDFIIWKQGVELMSHIQERPIIGRLGLKGIMPKWTDEDRKMFQSLSESLKHQRIYK